MKKASAETSKYSFAIAGCDMGSPEFMRALRATELSVPWSMVVVGIP